MAVQVNHVHSRRRGSFEFEDLPSAPQVVPTTHSHSPIPGQQRSRVSSNPNIQPALPAAGSVSAGPYRTSFNVVGTPNNPHARNGSISTLASKDSRGSFSSLNGRPSISSTTGIPIGAHGAHSRSPSLTSEYASPTFRSSFSSVNNDMNAWKSSLHDNPNGNANGIPNGASGSPPPSYASPSPAPSRKHSRIHSRNLSIFFPRPGVTAVHSIAEDGAQELEAPVSVIPTAGSTPHSKVSTPSSASFIPAPPLPRSQLGGGFKFGGRPPASASSTGTPDTSGMEIANSTSSGTQPSSVPMSKAGTPNTNATQTSSRRGHHHRHSLSHSFFSFMEPGSSPSFNVSPLPGQHRRQPSSGLSINVTGPSPTTAVTPATGTTLAGWGPISPFVASATSAAFPPAQLMPPKRRTSFQPSSLPNPSTQRSSSFFNKLLALPQDMQFGLLFGIVEGLIGCGLWAMGQHVESLACTGLAYWVVFDAVGATLGVYGGLVDAGAGQGSLRLPYGAKRTETVALFAQAIYLLFSAVYICKETIEHALLSAGDAGHHHHHPEGAILNTGLQYPTVFLWLSFINLSISSIFLKSNSKILDATGVNIPSPRQLLRSFSTTRTINLPTRAIPLILSNPYTLFPLICSLLLLLTPTLPLNQESQRTADMLIAGLEAFGTAYLAWPACLTLGKVLLQMAPERSTVVEGGLTAKGTMETLLRAMKEIERHPQVLHLPAPHVWQLSPASAAGESWEVKAKRDLNDIGAMGDGLGNGNLTSSLSAGLNVRRRTGGMNGGGKVIVTVELHVRKELEDVECLELTRWAWQRCVNALGQGEEGVSVGIVRG